MSNDQLDVVEFRGRATLSDSGQSEDIEVDFELFRSASNSYFSFLSISNTGNRWLRSALNSGNTVSLLGELSDGRKIACSRGGISLGNYFSIDEGAQGTLLPLSDVLIGVEQDCCTSMEVHLQGTLGIYVNTSIGEYRVAISSQEIDENEKHLRSKQHQSLFATTTIRVESKSRPKDDFLKIYESVTRVLCIGLGRSLSVTRFEFSHGDSTTYERWHERTGYGDGSQSVVLESCAEDYLQECVAKYDELQEEARDKINLASAYLTISEDGFADLQALQVIQAWELYARWQRDAKSAEAKRCDDESWVEELVKDLKVYRKRELLKKYPQMKADPDTWDRLIKFVRKVNASDPMTQLVNDSGLRADILGLDLKSHSYLANSVRHSGAMPNDIPIWEKRRTIDVSRLALRLILLRAIGYTGLIRFDDGGQFIKKNSILNFFELTEELDESKGKQAQQNDEAAN